MYIKHKSLVLALSLATTGLVVSGCGPQVNVDELRSMIDEATRTANLADYKASQAKDLADEALTKASMMGDKKMMMKHKDKMDMMHK